MGFLHQGHASLIERAREGNDIVVVSSFVNPSQFGSADDLAAYPRDAGRDVELAKGAGAHFLFQPSPGEMYPEGQSQTVVDPGPIALVGEGARRPGHFRGVATVCVKLFNIVSPDRAYFGQKDAQQLAVIRRVVRDLDIAIEIIGCPTVRASSGLALSSRNFRLGEDERAAAQVLFRSLERASEAARSNPKAASLQIEVEAEFETEPAVSLEYFEVVDPVSFEPVEESKEGSIMLLAAWVGGVRLIDSIEVKL